MFAQLYEVCLSVSPSLTPPVVDEMELWEIAVVLGKARPDEPENATSRASPPPTPTRLKQMQHESAMRRYEAIQRRKLGKPELPDDADRPAPLDPALATLIPTNAPERLR